MVLVPLAVAVLPVAIGATLALAPGSGSRLLGPIRVFALTASLAVIALHLVPDAWRVLGPWALLFCALGLAFPTTINALVRPRGTCAASGGTSERACVGLEVGYAGLLVHRVGDGFALAAVAYSHVGPAAQAGVYAALAAHAVPVAAVVCLAYLAAQSRRAALLRASLLAVPSMVGVLVARVVPFQSLERVDAYVAAVVAGLLLHVVSHDLHDVPSQRASPSGLKLAAALFGVSVGVIGALLH